MNEKDRNVKTGVYYRNSDVRVEERPEPKAGDRDIVVKVMACGLCGSDLLEWYRIKRAPLVLGHEPAGIVVEAGKLVTAVKPGDRVFVTHHVPCNACYHCLTGHETACTTFQSINNFEPGGFSQLLLVKGRSVETGTLLLPDSVSFEQATFIEPLGTAVRALRTAGLKPGQSVLVLGSGVAGLLIIKLARAMGAGMIVATDVSTYRLKRPNSSEQTIRSRPTRTFPLLSGSVNDNRLADVVILSAGALPAARTALLSAERGGTILFFAVPKPGETWMWISTRSGETISRSRPATALHRLDTMQALDLITARDGHR